MFNSTTGDGLPGQTLPAEDERATECPHPFDDVVYLGKGRWSCSNCGALIDGSS